MKERPILFSAPMVRAILDGRKTQTRRIVNARKTDINRFSRVHNPARQTGIRTYDSSTFRFSGDEEEYYLSCPYGQPGDRLWVREAFCRKFDDGYPVYNADGDNDASCCHYKADGTDVRCDDGDGGTKFNRDGSMASPWTPSIHMPRWASRISLEITGIRVERLNDISDADAFAEGTGFKDVDGEWHHAGGHPSYSIGAFKSLWESINGPESWSANPFVWVVEFEKLEAT